MQFGRCRLEGQRGRWLHGWSMLQCRTCHSRVLLECRTCHMRVLLECRTCHIRVLLECRRQPRLRQRRGRGGQRPSAQHSAIRYDRRWWGRSGGLHETGQRSSLRLPSSRCSRSSLRLCSRRRLRRCPRRRLCPRARVPPLVRVHPLFRVHPRRLNCHIRMMHAIVLRGVRMLQCRCRSRCRSQCRSRCRRLSLDDPYCRHC